MEQQNEQSKRLDACENPACSGLVGDDDLCTSCGVHHGAPCIDCGQRGWHTEECAELQRELAAGDVAYDAWREVR